MQHGGKNGCDVPILSATPRHAGFLKASESRLRQKVLQCGAHTSGAPTVGSREAREADRRQAEGACPRGLATAPSTRCGTQRLGHALVDRPGVGCTSWISTSSSADDAHHRCWACGSPSSFCTSYALAARGAHTCHGAPGARGVRSAVGERAQRGGGQQPAACVADAAARQHRLRGGLSCGGHAAGPCQPSGGAKRQRGHAVRRLPRATAPSARVAPLPAASGVAGAGTMSNEAQQQACAGTPHGEDKLPLEDSC
jgi:hypothetical protein